MKKLILGIIIGLMLLIIVVLSILLVKYINLYNKTIEPKFGYYLDKDLQITSVDLRNHNSIYEFFCNDNCEKREVIKIIEFIRNYDRNNESNPYLYVKILLNDEEYDVRLEKDYNELTDIISNGEENYLLNINYNDESGFINSITIKNI